MTARFSTLLLSSFLLGACGSAPATRVTSSNQARAAETQAVESTDSKSIEANPDFYVGKTVHLVENVGLAEPSCTRMFCGGENKCCNACSAARTVGANIVLRDAASGAPVACHANNCDIQNPCAPYDSTNPVELTGVVQRDGGKLFLDVTPPAAG